VRIFTFSRVVGLATAVLLCAVACGSGSDPGSSGGRASGSFPVTVSHKYGETTIPKAPKRVVAVGLTEQDALLALGIVPVGTTRWIGEYPGEIGPWAAPKLGDARPPTVLSDADGLEYEKIHALKPDVILALYSNITADQYQTLSRIAPTVAPPKGIADYGIPWQTLTRTVGKAVGKAREADRLVDRVDAEFARIRSRHPEFKNATGVVATTYQGYFVYGTEDPRSRMLTSLGFRLPDDLDRIIGDRFGANISPERADLLNTDAVVWIVQNVKKDERKLHASDLYGALRVARQHREVFLEASSDYGNAYSFVSVLSLPYVLDRLVPQLSSAVRGE
jgi:iron-siderophore transport system substrate-binding protein